MMSGRAMPLTVALLAGLAHPAVGHAQASAQDAVEAAKERGEVGERFDGYLGSRSKDAAINAAVAEVNARRRTLYASYASQRGNATEWAGRFLACQNVRRITPGHWYQDESNVWRRRGPDEAAPVPPGCSPF
jgi:uncharacterized protein YdbL (DUF1318 family)